MSSGEAEDALAQYMPGQFTVKKDSLVFREHIAGFVRYNIANHLGIGEIVKLVEEWKSKAIR